VTYPRTTLWTAWQELPKLGPQRSHLGTDGPQLLARPIEVCARRPGLTYSSLKLDEDTELFLPFRKCAASVAEAAIQARPYLDMSTNKNTGITCATVA
jgi:hypothetical protein